ncbi:ABC transporter substrate-binding protein [Paenibacillus sp. CN-4]|uniref:ABC transporter substrate-binding protein n=1 Tax=Paenibacillus nanchangensis TaxID=3348343 RepID=UPI00397B8FE5
MTTYAKIRRTLGRCFGAVLCISLLLPLHAEQLSTAWAENAPAAKGPQVLRIGTLYSGEDDTYFRQQFTDLYELQHPDVKLEIVPAVDQNELRYQSADAAAASDPLEGMRKLIEGDRPVDVIVGDASLLGYLTEQQLVRPLQPLIDRDGYDLSDMAPSMLEGVKELGKGSLYALAPTFSSSALYYNQSLFDDAGVEYPRSGMTWDEVLALAAQVSKPAKDESKRIYGLSVSRYANDPYWDMSSWMMPLQLAMYDSEASAMTVNNDSWKKVWTTYSKLVRDGVVPQTSTSITPQAAASGPIAGDLFLQGRAAMVTAESYYINELVEANRHASNIKGYKPFEWDVVTMPSFPEQPGVGQGTWIGNLMSVSANASNPEGAWDLIKFVNSREVARIKAHNRYELTSRTSSISSAEPGLSMEPFYTMKPVPPADPELNRLLLTMPGIGQISDAGRLLFNEVCAGRMTVEEALAAWEKQGNHMLLEMKTDPDKVFDLNDPKAMKEPIRS